MDAFAFLLAALATYRVATDVAWEDGPGDLFAWLRGQALQRFGPAHWLTNGLSCPICLSFWLAPVALLLWLWLPWIVTWLAVAGTVAVLARLR